MSDSKTLLVIVPCFNEENSITSVIAGLKSIKFELTKRKILLKICIINDGSQDKTAEKAKEANIDLLLEHKCNQGLGAAVRTGLIAAKKMQADITVKFDADLQHNPKDIIRLIQPILDDESDIVYGNRFNKISYKMPFVRSIGNKVFIRLMRFLTNWDLKDSQPGIFAVNNQYLNVFRLPGNYNYTQQVLLDAYHKNMRFSHVDVEFHQRQQGTSFVNFKYPFKVLPQLFWVIVGVAPMRIFVPVGLFFVTIATSIFLWQISHFLLGDSTRPIHQTHLVLGTGLFGIQCIFFGILAQLIIENKSREQ